MRPICILPLMIFALAGCGSDPASDPASEPAGKKSASEVIAQARPIAKPLPGLYETSARLQKFSVSGVPDEHLAVMKQQFAASSNRTEAMCLTKEDADQGFEKMLRQMSAMGDDMNCAFSRFDASGTTLTAQLNCTAPGGTSMAMAMDGTVAPDRSDMTMTMKSSSDMMAGREMTMVMHTAARRIGDCPG